MDMRVIEVTDFKSKVRFDLWDNLESNIGKLPLQVMRGSPLVWLDYLTKFTIKFSRNLWSIMTARATVRRDLKDHQMGTLYKNLKSRWHQEVFDPGAFKLDHLQPVKLILFQRISTFLPFILGAPIFLITPERGRKEGAGADNGEKGITPKWMRLRGFWPWGIQTGPFAAC